jgi:hypothetical protein
MKVRILVVEADDVAAGDVAEVVSRLLAGTLSPTPPTPLAPPAAGGQTALPPPPTQPSALPSPAHVTTPRKARATTAPPLAAPAATTTTAVAPASNGNGQHAPRHEGRVAKRDIECLQKPGEKFTLAQAAALAGVQTPSICGGLARAKDKNSEWATVGKFNFRRPSGSPEMAAAGVDLHEARSRFSKTAQAINPNINGGAATITHADQG